RSSLLWAASNGVSLAIRSGGHSYAGYSTTSGLLVDASLMNEVAIHDAEGLVRMWGRRAQRQCLCQPSPGQSRHHAWPLHGSGRCRIGARWRDWLQPTAAWVLTCDQMIETEIVTAAGELVVCNKDQNPDLFWACRGGGGGNFGVNVSFTLESFPVDVMTVFKLGWTDHLDELLPAALDLLPTTPDRLGCKLSGTPLELELLGQLVVTEAELRALLAPLYRIGAPGEEIISTLSYWDAQGIL